MTHEFRKIVDDEQHLIYVIQPQSLNEDGQYQKIISRNPVLTHRPAAKWVQAKRQNGSAWELLVYSEEIPLAEVAKASDNFEKLGGDSLRWLVGRHKIKLTEIPRAAGDDKTDRSERAIMLRAVREFAKSAKAEPTKVTATNAPTEPPTGISDMSDAELEEAAALLGALPSKWRSMRREEKEAVYVKALGQKKVLQEAMA